MRSTTKSSRAVAVAGRRVSANNADSPRQSARPGEHLGFAASFRAKAERASLHDVGAFRVVSRCEQHFARLNPIALGADGQDAQRRCAERAQNWYPLKERDVVLDRHSGRKLRHKLVPARFSNQDRRGCGILLDLLP